MTRPTRQRHLGLRLALAATAVVVVALSTPPADAAGSHSLIQGSGSSWSANAVNQWIADVQSNGLQVVFTANGSAQGRKDYANKTNDFAVTEIGYQGSDSVTGEPDTSQGRAYAYLPIVSGGTAFPYQIRVRGQLVRDLRLSGETLAKIFTNQITDWSDAAITADNNGRKLPSLPIIPVVHSEGSGSSAHFTDYLDKQYPNIWRPYSGRAGLTEYYPRQGSMIAQSGSDGVMNFIASNAANGAIGFDEYSYALGKNYPVAKIENANQYFTLPTQYNVAVALTQAIINQDKSSPDYLLQNLANVYTYGDPRTYPLSSYSYMIIPTAPDDAKMTTAKRQTIGDFLYYSICDGQKEMGPIGYSPLPINLVQAGFEQTNRLKQADPGVDLSQRDVSTCHNPTFVAGQPNRNYLAEIAPQPPACDKAGQGPCADSASDAVDNAGGAAGGPAAGAGGGGGGNGPGANDAGSGSSVDAAQAGDGGPSGTDASAANGDASESAAAADPLAAAAGAAKTGTVGSAGAPQVLVPLALALLAFAVIAPGFLIRAFNRRSKDVT